MAASDPGDAHVRDLRYFVAVARDLSFTRAAAALYVSQPALSKQIHAGWAPICSPGGTAASR